MFFVSWEIGCAIHLHKIITLGVISYVGLNKYFVNALCRVHHMWGGQTDDQYI